MYRGVKMKKKSSCLRLLVLACSIVTMPIQGIDFLSFKNKLAGYRDCILKRRPCTIEQKATLGTMIATLLTLIVTSGAIFGYKWYKNNIALSWDGMQRLLEQYEVDVRTNLPMNKFTGFNIDLLKKFKSIIAQKGLSTNEIDAIEKGLDTLIGGDVKQGTMQHLFSFVLAAGTAITYESLQSIYQSNLNPISMFNIRPDGIYTYLGLTPVKGKEMSFAQVKENIKEKVKQLSESGKYSKNDLAFLGRQLEYVFNTADQKKQYDAFMQGPEAVKKLEIKVDPDIQERQTNSITAILEQLGYLRQQLIKLKKVSREHR